MKMMKPITLTLFIAALIVGLSGWSMAAGSDTKDEKGASKNAVQVIVTGQNYCVACALKADGAKGACKAKGCGHALEVESAKTVDGKKLKDMKGWTLHYLDTPAAEAFSKGHHFEKVTVTGTVYLKQRVLEVAPKA